MCNAAVSTTSLDSWKTSELQKAIQAIDREYLLGGEEPSQDRWLQAIRSNPLSLKHIQRYESCGTNAWIQENTQNGRCKVTFNTCKLRCCRLCARKVKQRTKLRLESALQGKTLKKWRLITLTQVDRKEPLTDSIFRLRLAFKNLRKSENWKKYITGGYAVLEITRNEAAGTWHPHFHVVAGGLFYPWRDLKADWGKVAEGATNTDIRPIKTTKGAIHYLTSYLGQLPDANPETPIEVLSEYYRSIQGQRFLVTFGKAPPPVPEKKLDNTTPWRPICPLHVYICALRDCLTWALVLDRKLRKKPLDDLYDADWHPPPSTA